MREALLHEPIRLIEQQKHMSDVIKLENIAKVILKQGQILPHQLSALQQFDRDYNLDKLTVNFRNGPKPVSTPVFDEPKTDFKPNRKPREFGFKRGDTHIVVDATNKTAKAYDFDGKLLWTIPCMATGQDPNWRIRSGDTPPGLYKLGTVYNDYAKVGRNPAYDRTLMSYGWVTFDMIDLEGNEDNSGRAGICLHGGGSALSWPGAWAPKQKLYATLGCLRAHNIDLVEKVLPRYQQGVVFISVYQDRL